MKEKQRKNKLSKQLLVFLVRLSMLAHRNVKGVYNVRIIEKCTMRREKAQAEMNALLMSVYTENH